MRPHFISYTTTLDDFAFHCGVNLSFKSEAPIAGLEWRAHVRIDLKRPTSEGLATQEEEVELYQIEDRILAALSGVDHRFVSQVTHQERRTMVIYLGEEMKADHPVFATIKSHKVQLIDCIHDPEWSEYKEILYPTPEIEKKLLSDMPRLKALAERGDDCAQLHAIKATYLAADAAAAEKLAASLKKDGFKVLAVTKVTGVPNAAWRVTCETQLPLGEATIDGFRQIAEKTRTMFEDWTAEIVPVESEGRAKKKKRGAKKAGKKTARVVGRRIVKRAVARRAPKKAASAAKKSVKKTAVARRKAARRGPRRG